MKSYFAYIRVSTVKQGEHGSSLQEQRAAITGFATRLGLPLIAWFEERETAAKSGRHEFTRMMAALQKGKASGVIFHKIDRSARNLRDWSAIQDLADQGIDVRFTQESINLSSNEGKLTGDFLAVISSHYIRNLREEVRKGIRGRLKQGFFPFHAPIGYLDQGAAKAKIPDPERAPLVRTAFDLYGTSRFSLRSLDDELYRQGLRTTGGKRVGIARLAKILRNPFYAGIIRMRQSGETYQGVHRPIVPIALFEHVQRVLDGKNNAKVIRHDFLFRRMISCAHCKYRLIGERKKGHVYYRCHTDSCPTTSIREEVAHKAIHNRLASAALPEELSNDLREMTAMFFGDRMKRREEYVNALNLRLDNLGSRLSRLTDAYLDGAVDRTLFNEKKESLLMERKALEEQLSNMAAFTDQIETETLEYLERAKALPLNYEIGTPGEKRELLKFVTSNLGVNENNVVVELRSPFSEVEKLMSVPNGGPLRDSPRTLADEIFSVLIKHFDMSAPSIDRIAA